MSESIRPVMPRGYLGAQPMFAELGLYTISHNDPEIVTDDNQFEIKIGTSRPTKVTANLTNARTLQSFTENVFSQMTDNVISFLVNVPTTGYYKLQVYALPSSDDSKTLPGVFNYLVLCNATPTDPHPYPKQYAPWKNGCFLFEPLSLTNESQLNNVHFKVRIPNAKSVAVTSDGEWQHLDTEGDDVWQGNVSLEKYRGTDSKISLNANFGGDTTKYATLLDYSL
ncbi:kyphoscoliosis peptidase-like [Gigantopelta aegis]|uniref:kyphoscoliosis peptidase-like n=1 Tax=Gigantopelta aegis TaxID=1735272 RepID=UPI001B88B9D8|nr:kyphoscoliosis peptidase-like [Gigantopelta aegis]